MPYKRFHELSEEKKKLILQTSLDTFSENSFKNASINKISKNAKLSAGALYYYFEDKKDLFNTTLDYLLDMFTTDTGSLDQLFDVKGYWEGIKFIVLKRLELGAKEPKYLKLYQRILHSEDEQEIEIKEKLQISFRKIFDYGYNHGFIRRDVPKEFLYSMHLNMSLTVNQWTIDRHLDENKKAFTTSDLEDISMKAVDMIYRAISVTDEKGEKIDE